MSVHAYLEHSGRLLYAMAAIDGAPVRREVERVHRDILKLTSVDERKGGGPDWLLAMVSFDQAVDNDVRPSAILQEFESYATGQGFHHVSPVLRHALWELLRKTADSAGGVSRPEEGLLDRLHGILKPELP
jgi:hypothetical protein